MILTPLFTQTLLPPQLVPFFPWAAGLLGLVLGSFYTVCVHRYLTEQSIVLPGSHCPHCHHPLSWWENIPLLSYVLLWGRCRACKTAISWRYPLMEALSATWAVAIAVRFGPCWLWVALMTVGGLFLVASFIDLVLYILPDALTLPGAALGIATGILGLDLTMEQSLIGAIGGAGFFWLLRFVYLKTKGIEALGMGDVKLMLMIGGLTGWMGLPAAILFAGVGALAFSPFFVWGSKDKGRTPIPFGPFLCLGCMLALLWGDALMRLLAGV